MTNSNLNSPQSITTISRQKHDKEHPYLMVSKDLIRDKDLSIKSRGVLIYLLSFPDDWQFNYKIIAKEIGIGVNQFYSCLKEIISCGYGIYHVERNQKGQITKHIYQFSEIKQSHNNCEPFHQNPDLDNQDLENSDYTKERKKLNIEETKQPPQTPPIQKPKMNDLVDWFSCLDRIDLNESDKKSIMRQGFEEKDVDNAIKIYEFDYLKKGRNVENVIGLIISLAKQKKVLAVPTPSSPENNRSLASKKMNLAVLPTCAYFEILSSSIEIGYRSGQKEPSIINFDSKGFESQLDNAVRKHGGYFKNENEKST